MSLHEPPQTPHLPSRLARGAAGLVFVVMLVVGGLSAAWSIVKRPVDAPSQAWSSRALVQGETARTLTATLEQAPLPQIMARLERGGSWLVSGSLGPRVRQGCKGWLFLVDELVLHPDGKQSALQRLNAVSQLRQQLHSKGIDLLVVTVPDKSRVQFEQLCGIYRPTSFQGRLEHWESELSQRGVWHVSVTQELRGLVGSKEEPFLRVDTHWSQAGAKRVAQMIAQHVTTKGLTLTPVQHYIQELGEPVFAEGDLVRLAGIDWLPLSLQPAPDKVMPRVFDSVSRDAAGMADATAHIDDSADDLFGELSLPSVALVGTSYSRASSFRQFLEQGLNTPVPGFAQDGGDFWGSAKAYFSSPDFHETPPRLVIWEIPERVVQMPISSSEHDWIQSLNQDVNSR